MSEERAGRYMDGVFATELKAIREIIERVEHSNQEWRRAVIEREDNIELLVKSLERRVEGLERVKWVMHGAWATVVIAVKFFWNGKHN